MTNTPVSSSAEHTESENAQSDGGRPSQGHRHRWLLAGTLVVVIAAAVGIGVTNPFVKSAPSRSGASDNASPTSLWTVARRDLSSQTSENATLGYAGSYTVVNQATGTNSSPSASSSSADSAGGASSGTFTALPAVGQLVSRGQVLYQVNGEPVVLLYGSTPAYRSLSEGMSGADVTELNGNLVALGYATSSEISPTSDSFGGRRSTRWRNSS